jgi:hypothetical protein
MAHGGGEVQLAAEPAGPYRLTVWMNPGTAQAGRTTHITVAVADGVDQSAVLDAAVVVEVWSGESGERILASPATTEQSTNKLYYETDFILPDSGLVEISVKVSGPAGEGQAGYQTTVEKAQSRAWLRFVLVGLGVLAMVAVWIVWKGWQPARPRPARRRRLANGASENRPTTADRRPP